MQTFNQAANNGLTHIKAKLNVSDDCWTQTIKHNKQEKLWIIRFEVSHGPNTQCSTGWSFLAKSGADCIRKMDQFIIGLNFRNNMEQTENYYQRIAPRNPQDRIPA